MPQSEKHFDFAFRGFKFLETEDSNFCEEGSYTNASPAYATTPMNNKKASDGIQYRQMPLFLRFPRYSVFPFVSIKRVLFPLTRENTSPGERF